MLALWRERDVFRRSVEERPDAPLFSFYEGPPTANGNPGVHHVLARVFKDLIPRYRTMRGYRVPRKGGWDTHGLPVELEVERELGLSSKREIEAYGVEAFNQKCRESVFRYVAEWERMTERIGFWIDMDEAYATYSNDYIETCWWIFQMLWRHDLVFRDYRVTPHCPRCETSLSSHEIALGYREDTTDPSVTVRFRLDRARNPEAPAAVRLADGVPTAILAWTTTPWTLSGNTALAVAPEAEYALIEANRDGNTERLVLAAARVAAVTPEAKLLATFPGRTLLGLRYEPLYDVDAWPGVEARAFVDGRAQPLAPGETPPARRVIASPAVSTEDGTGVLHVAPAFGAEDYALGRDEGLMFLQPVTLSGTMIGGPGDGVFAKQADEPIMRDLAQRGLLWRRETVRHTYPFCWRCGTPVLYYAKPSWYIRTTAVKERLLEHNRAIHWVPEHLRDGRFGEWLEGNVDWAVSRERYWGTPLPLWLCELCGHVDCIGSYAELRQRARAGTIAVEASFDPHRPYVDAVELDCPQCNGTMRRTPEVADAWFDSGAMPYAQWHYPFEHAGDFAARFPADFICEAVDQTRGWFYTLHALATLLHRVEEAPQGIAYRNVISLGLILDGEGQKMSKSRGNVVDPWTVLDEHGADALRWYLYTAAPPGNERRFSSPLVGDAARRFLSTLWNTCSFFVTYANLADFDPASPPPAGARSELDRWVRSELHRTVERATEALEAYEPSDAARPIGEFVDQLSNWYVRRSRRRFWKSDDSADTQAALHTLYECLTTVTRLLAPFTPFIAEALYQNLVAGRLAGAPDSVHLDAWPQADAAAIDEQLSADVALVQRMASLGRAARAKAQLRVRQPLQMVWLVPRHDAQQAALNRFKETIRDELNVKYVEVTGNASSLQYRLRPNLPVLGPRLGKDVQRVRRALDAADAALIMRRMRRGEPIELDGFVLTAADILVDEKAPAGWSVASEAGYSVVLETAITPELLAEGWARDVVRLLQDLRRDAGFAVSDRIHVRYTGDDAVRAVFAAHGGYIAEETLALSIEEGDAAAGDDGARAEASLDGHATTLAVRRAQSP
ncbi:MAG: isoleucine--tRNA ligase [Dehalococcoidia bacterium]|nr:isoleucine--tRNA ligase [Dehalococcoidia bacterium]